MSEPRRIVGSAAAAARWCRRWRTGWSEAELLLLLAATDTAAVPGISAAGSTPASRRRTAAADAELLLLGPAGQRPHALPSLPAGVSPALISHVVLRELALAPLRGGPGLSGGAGGAAPAAARGRRGPGRPAA